MTNDYASCWCTWQNSGVTVKPTSKVNVRKISEFMNPSLHIYKEYFMYLFLESEQGFVHKVISSKMKVLIYLEL